MTKFLITGGAGFIGSHVVDLLASQNHQLLVIDNFSTGKSTNLAISDHVLLVDGDIRNYEMVIDYFSDFRPEKVIHLAAQAAITTAIKDPYEDASVNILGIINVLKASKKVNVDRFVYSSTSAVYGDKVTLKIVEGVPWYAPDNPYGVSKFCAELYVRITDIQHTILRLGNVYGPRQVPIGENQVIARMMRHFFNGDDFEIFGDGKQKRDFIYVTDVAEAIKLACFETYVQDNVYNISGGKSYSVNSILVLLERICEVEGYKWTYDLLRKDERQNMIMDIRSAQKNLNWTPKVSLQEGIKKTVEWWSK